MYRILILLHITFLLLISTNTFAVSHNIATSTTPIDGSSINPGDTIKLLQGIHNYLLFRNIHGNASNSVVIINEGGQVTINSTHYYGIKFENCSYIKMTGSGHASYQYGIYIASVTSGTGVTVDNLSTNFEMERVEVSNIPIAGIYVKTEPTCTLESTRPNFTMYDIKIHDCYFHDIEDEGMYIGSSKYTGQDVGCGILLPHVIEGVWVYNNVVENTGWDGIQVSSATQDCYIYNNTIRSDSYRETTNQMSGILIGGGSDCECYNNKIFDGKGDGIDILGLGNHKIYNNLIVRPGISYKPQDGPTSYQKHGIWVGHVVTTPGAEMLIYNNTFINPKTHGIKLTNVYISSCKIYNNIISEPSSYSLLQNNSYLNTNVLINYQLANNLFTNQESTIQFNSPVNEDYDLDAFSPAVNNGLDLTNLGLTFDIDNKSRPFGGAFDIGAYESHASGIGINEGNLFINTRIVLYDVNPNPIYSSAVIKYELKEPLDIKLCLKDINGKLIDVLIAQMQDAKLHTFEIHKNSLPSGIYFLTLESKFGLITKKIVFI
jgi:hypothetical protein